MLERWINFVVKFVTWIAGTGALWVATLDHEIGDYAVKHQAIKKGLAHNDIVDFELAFCQTDEISDSHGCFLVFQLTNNNAFIGGKARINTILYFSGVLCMKQASKWQKEECKK